ncbi:MAG TPA: tetratricopeptide repeat-containing glycosyltransferase family protein [Caldimonas sp.]|nr:tetratricopeptide repeat-containing glycosyltransferase family protein [Caldimonas sp.]
MSAAVATPIATSDALRFQAANAQGIKAVQAGTPGKAIAYYLEALEILRDPLVLDNLGDAYARSGELDKARAAFEEAISLKPDHAQAHYNLAVVHEQREDYEAARTCYRNSLACRVLPNAENNLGNVEFWLVHLEAAEACYRSAVKHGYGDAIWNLSLCLLMQGKYREAWDWYDLRPQMVAMRGRERQWRGDVLHDKTLVIVTEQGLGDSIFMLRYIPLLRRQGARLKIVCDPGLRRIIQRQLHDDDPELPPAEVLDKTATGTVAIPGDAFDYETLAMSIPGYVSPDGTGPNTPYLKAPTIPLAGGVKVGLCWNGSTAIGAPAERNIPLKALAPLAEIPGVVLYSLQKGDGVDEIADCGFKIVDAMQGVTDVYDTATIIASLDLVITIDTLIPHLAGALGKPTWLMNRFASCWQWGTEKFDPKLYATVQQFRQPRRGDWAPVVEQVTAALRHLADVKAMDA